MNSFTRKSRISNYCLYAVYAVVFTIVFEGIIRKFIPAISTPVFFLKDFLCLAGLVLISNVRLEGAAADLKSVWTALFFLLVPLLFVTAFKDLFLGIFAAKQYLLYIVAGMLMIIAFPASKAMQFRRFLFVVSLMLVPTTLVAILQNSLPPSHWLNMSVGGESLEAFSAGGYLRVGSTFSFTGQYSWFLNAECFFLVASFCLPPVFKSEWSTYSKILVYTVLGMMLVISAFITGGRTAVIGCGSTLLLGLFLIALRRPKFLITTALPVTIACGLFLVVFRQVKPQFFKAYDERSAGNQFQNHNQEVAGRIFNDFTKWTEWFWDQNNSSVLIGNGLGIMSNGSAQISNYASQIRANGFWTEEDMATTFWEGGLYLALIWYGFRVLMIAVCFRLWLSLRTNVFIYAASVPLSYVVINGLKATLGMQPPLFIWWCISLGTIIVIHRLERRQILA